MSAVAKVRLEAPNAARIEAATGLMADAAAIGSEEGGVVEGRLGEDETRKKQDLRVAVIINSAPR